jgi:hypothetical protein
MQLDPKRRPNASEVKRNKIFHSKKKTIELIIDSSNGIF